MVQANQISENFENLKNNETEKSFNFIVSIVSGIFLIFLLKHKSFSEFSRNNFFLISEQTKNIFLISEKITKFNQFNFF